MISKLFGQRAEPVFIDKDELFRRLDLNGKQFESDPDEHIRVLDFLGEYTLRGSSHYGPAKSFYTDPEEGFTVKEPPPEFSTQTEPTERKIRSSECVSYTEDGAPFGKRVFALIIRDRARSLRDMRDSVKFGLYGVYDKQGRMKIKKIMTPGIDETGRMTPLQHIPLTPENVQISLRYAELCVETLKNGTAFYPRQCLGEALREKIAQTGIPILEPAP